MFRRRDSVAARGIHDDHTMLGCRLNIDIVNTHSGPTHNFKVFGRCKDSWCDLGLAADDQTGKVGDDLDKFGFLESCLDDNLNDTSFGKGFNSTRGDGIGNKNFGNGTHGQWDVVGMAAVIWILESGNQ